MAWFPVLLRYGGLGMVFLMALFWALTDRVEPALLGLFGSMIGIGEGADAIRDLALANRQATAEALQAADEREGSG